MRGADCPNSTPRPRLARLDPMPWWTLLMLATSFASLSGCAGTPQAPNADPPRLVITESLRNGEALCIKGRLPFGETLELEDVADLALAEGARARCEQSRGDALVDAADDFNAAWEALFGAGE